jgi:radical SAM protein with 4Fe4S-binding SPASM domain
MEAIMQHLVLQPEFTNHCNFKCILCPQHIYKNGTQSGNTFDREKGFMSQELFDLFVINANKYAEAVLIGYFGEPLLHPRFNEFIESFPKQRNYTIGLYTNWSLFSKKNIEAIKMCDRIFISLDASYPELWNKLCPGGHVLDLDGNPCVNRYETICKKIEYWLNLSGHSCTQIVYVTSSYNEHDVKNFVKQWKPKLKYRDEILTKSVLSYGGVINDVHMRKNTCNIVNEKRFTVSWNGDCTPCNLDVNVGLHVGNLNEVKDIQTIIGSDKYKKRMENIKQHKGICSNCFDANNWTEHKIYNATSWPKKISSIMNKLSQFNTKLNQ